MRQFVYPAILAPDDEEEGIVRFADLPEAITQGMDVKNALSDAADCLEEAIANRIVIGLPIPRPSGLKKGQHAVPLRAQTAAKAALYIAMREAKIGTMELAGRLHCKEEEERHLLDPRRPSGLQRLEAALAAVNQKLIVSLQTAANL